MISKFEGYSLDNNELLIFNNEIYIHLNDELRSLILSEEHQEMYMAHPRVMKMKVDLNPLLFWK
jgi:hypothetical protein